MAHKRASIRARDKEWGEQIASGLVDRMERGAIVVITDRTIRVDKAQMRPYDKEEAGSPEGQQAKPPGVLQ